MSARLRHIAVVVKDLQKAARFYETAFELRRVGEETLDFADAIYLTDGVINLALLNYKGERGSGLEELEGLRRRAPLRLPGRRPRRGAEAHRGGAAASSSSTSATTPRRRTSSASSRIPTA